MKPKINRKGNPKEPKAFDFCQTPPYALDPLLPFLRKDSIIWEPARGTGTLTRTLRENGYTVFESDILDGQNFFEFVPAHFDIIVTNPPYSIKYDWIQRCYMLGKPFALLLPVESIGSQKGQALYDYYGFEWLLLNQRVDFEMPHLGFSGHGAQFPTFWSCWQLLPENVVFGSMNKPRRSQKQAKLEAK